MFNSQSNLETLQKSADIQPMSWALSISKSGSINSAERKYFLLCLSQASSKQPKLHVVFSCLPSKSLKNILIFPIVHAVSMILESLEKASVGIVSSWAPLIVFLRILSCPKIQIVPVSSVLTMQDPSGANMQFRTASLFGWWRTSVFWPVATSHRIIQPSTDALATTDP